MSKLRKTIVLVLLLSGIIGLGVWQWKSSPKDGHSHESATAGKTLYHCPMHPHIISDKPGQCPICKMDFVKIEEPKAEFSSERKILFYRHPMRPDITSKVPAKDSMGMDYIPVYADEALPKPSPSEPEIAGRAAFPLSQENQQKIGVATVRAEEHPLTQEIRATGRVAYDPELYTAIEEYRQAVIAQKQLKDSSYQGFQEQSTALVKSSETRLKLLGLTEEQIRSLARSPSKSLNLLLPEGRVWVYAEVFEYEVAGLINGQRIEADAPSIPGEIFKGTISSISPVLNAPTRTVRVRAEVPDPQGLLRPDTYLNVRIIKDMGRKLAVPEDAILYTGSQAYVFVKDDNDRFTPRAVEIGARVKGFQEIKSGLSTGENVVTGANFLIDSESRLKSVLLDKTP